ncbi:MAG TPA: hypothetical protein DCZ74_09160 [Treponema sp.]|nr:hypothetical protein [Treponema sp.]
MSYSIVQANKWPRTLKESAAFALPYEAECCKLFSMIEARDSSVMTLTDDDGFPHGVFAYTKGKVLLPCLPEKNDDVIDALQSFLYTHPVFCISGKTEFINTVQTALEKTGTQVLKESRDFGFFIREKKSAAETRSPAETEDDVVFVHCGKKDAQRLIPLQLDYIREEVLPEEMKLNPAAERLSLERHLKEGAVYALMTKDGAFTAKAQINAQTKNFALVGGVFTAPNFRRRGHAGFLMENVSRKMEENKKTAVLFANKSNTAALSLYESCGFVLRSEYKICYYD